MWLKPPELIGSCWQQKRNEVGGFEATGVADSSFPASWQFVRYFEPNEPNEPNKPNEPDEPDEPDEPNE